MTWFRQEVAPKVCSFFSYSTVASQVIKYTCIDGISHELKLILDKVYTCHLVQLNISIQTLNQVVLNKIAAFCEQRYLISEGSKYTLLNVRSSEVKQIISILHSIKPFEIQMQKFIQADLMSMVETGSDNSFDEVFKMPSLKDLCVSWFEKAPEQFINQCKEKVLPEEILAIVPRLKRM